MQVAVIGWPGQETNPALVHAWRSQGIDAVACSPDQALWRLGTGDVAVVRLDVLETLDGVQPGLPTVRLLGRRGVRLLNRPSAVLAAHDKLITARCLRASGIPHPPTVHVASPGEGIELRPPVVVKPRYGSWGRDVFRCSSTAALTERLEEVQNRPWFVAHGALVQELVPPRGHDLRLIVAGGRVVGAAARHAAAHEWRTNVSLGGTLTEAAPEPEACQLAIAATAAVGIDLAGVDLLPLAEGGHAVLELNAAVDFDRRYSLTVGNVYRDAAIAVGLLPAVQAAVLSATIGALRPNR